MNIKGKKILIVGFGKSGQSAARYCLENGASVTVTDLRPESDLDSNLPAGRHGTQTCLPAGTALKPACRQAWHSNTFFGSHPIHLFKEADIIVLSPGVPPTLEGIKTARKRKIPVVGEMELVLEEVRSPIIAVTGTNGKSTVTTLIGEMIRESGMTVWSGGNLGIPLIDWFWRTTSDERRATKYVVLEVSSYQLEISPNFRPHIAVLLNITPDHLDRYASYEAYINAKALITKNLTQDDYLVFNEDDQVVARIAKEANGQRVGFSLRKYLASLPNCSRRAPASGGSFATTGVVDLARAKITGTHNKENLLAAVAVARLAGCDDKSIGRVVEEFPGLPHRNQFVREVKGVRYFDDSKGTNVGAVVKSLEGFDSKVVLIAGGLDKGGGYTLLRPLVKQKVKALVLIGAAKDLIARELSDLTEVVMAEGMPEAVREAASRALPGDVVLLSPACASFDMFKDYAHRGKVFIEEVEKL